MYSKRLCYRTKTFQLSNVEKSFFRTVATYLLAKTVKILAFSNFTWQKILKCSKLI